MKTTDAQFERDVDIWTKEFERLGVRGKDIENIANRALSLRSDVNRLATKPNHFPLSVTEIIAAYDVLKEERRRMIVLDAPCDLCTLAIGNCQACPYHKFDYRRATVVE